uniref:40S ribosomal protein S2 n=1 Tax=Pleurostomum flabellatum TaxID=405751 RepID=A0A7T0Q4Y0_9EUKA|nr:40S ribosomal protein S2 [Pleurostomum flabellatum]QPL15606.1 40S ribosomal protein S2 [Pleurostomum flabellatum]
MINIKNLLLSLGAHIGTSRYQLDNFYKPFILGIRNNYYIFDIRYVILCLKKAIFFFRSMGRDNCNFLFYCSYHGGWRFFFRGLVFHRLSILNQSFVWDNWKPGMISNLSNHCKQIFLDLFQFRELKRQTRSYTSSKRITFYFFFFRILFFVFRKKSTGVQWKHHLIKTNKYWRFFLFFKFYKNLNKIPDSFLYFPGTGKSSIIPARECFHLEVPVISLLDSNFHMNKYVTYPLIGNSKSVFLHTFYFCMLIDAFSKGRKDSYMNLQLMK